MTIELPDAETNEFTAEELRLELACALYARGRVGKARGSEIAGVDFFTFQGALSERGIPMYTTDMLQQDTEALKKLFGYSQHPPAR